MKLAIVLCAVLFASSANCRIRRRRTTTTEAPEYYDDEEDKLSTAEADLAKLRNNANSIVDNLRKLQQKPGDVGPEVGSKIVIESHLPSNEQDSTAKQLAGIMNSLSTLVKNANTPQTSEVSKTVLTTTVQENPIAKKLADIQNLLKSRVNNGNTHQIPTEAKTVFTTTVQEDPIVKQLTDIENMLKNSVNNLNTPQIPTEAKTVVTTTVQENPIAKKLADIKNLIKNTLNKAKNHQIPTGGNTVVTTTVQETTGAAHSIVNGLSELAKNPTDVSPASMAEVIGSSGLRLNAKDTGVKQIVDLNNVLDNVLGIMSPNRQTSGSKALFTTTLHEAEASIESAKGQDITNCTNVNHDIRTILTAVVIKMSNCFTDNAQVLTDKTKAVIDSTGNIFNGAVRTTDNAIRCGINEPLSILGCGSDALGRTVQGGMKLVPDLAVKTGALIIAVPGFPFMVGVCLVTEVLDTFYKHSIPVMSNITKCIQSKVKLPFISGA